MDRDANDSCMRMHSYMRSPAVQLRRQICDRVIVTSAAMVVFNESIKSYHEQPTLVRCARDQEGTLDSTQCSHWRLAVQLQRNRRDQAQHVSSCRFFAIGV